MMILVTSEYGEGYDEPTCMHDLVKAFASRINKSMQVEDNSEQLLDI